MQIDRGVAIGRSRGDPGPIMKVSSTRLADARAPAVSSDNQIPRAGARKAMLHYESFELSLRTTLRAASSRVTDRLLDVISA